jgi:putative SOS response-associated peptidase YedK
VSWKLSRTVLRGAVGGNAARLLDLKASPKKRPFHFGMKDDSLFAFAGLWDCWNPPGDTPVESCTILTTAANSLVADLHDRMPVILPREHYEAWLMPSSQASTLVDFLAPLTVT